MIYRLDLKEYVNNIPQDKPNSTHFICECKHCIENEGRHDRKLYIKKDYSVGYCFRCESSYVNKLDAPKNDFDKVTPIPTFTPFKSKNLDFPNIDVSYYLESDNIDDISRDYLIKRNPRLDYFKFKLKCRYNRIVIPFYFKDELIYYQVRYINPLGSKYFNPKTEHKPLYLVPGQEITDKVILAEGTFDVMALDCMYGSEYTKVGLLGKTITASQMKFFKYYGFKKFIISLDELELSIKLRKKVEDELNAECQVMDTQLDPEEYVRSKC